MESTSQLSQNLENLNLNDNNLDFQNQQLQPLHRIENLEYEMLTQEQMIEQYDYITNIEQDLGQLIQTHKPKIARACPFRVKLEKGKSYLYCTCGHSQTQPFCDGAHRALQEYYVEVVKEDGSIVQQKYQPLKVDIEKQQSSFLWCGCKRNCLKAGASCDGSHSRISDW